MAALAVSLIPTPHVWLTILLPAAVLTAFVSVIAYIHSPRMKTLVFSLPVPFTCAYLATGMQINATHIAGLVWVTLYHWIVYLIYKRLGWSLWLGIGSGAIFYLGAAAAFGSIAKESGLTTFPVPIAISVVFVLWAGASWLYHPIHEPGHRSRAPWYLKAPIIFPIAIVLFSLKEVLLGAVTTFPYAGVFTSYEMRHSPRTLAGQYTINNISFMLMFLTLWALDGRVPKPLPLLTAWVVLVTVLLLIYRFGWGQPKDPVPAGE
jgi:hypothetical protein